MSIALFAIIGSIIDAGVGYWICFAMYSVFRVADGIKTAIEKS